MRLGAAWPAAEDAEEEAAEEATTDEAEAEWPRAKGPGPRDEEGAELMLGGPLAADPPPASLFISV